MILEAVEVVWCCFPPAGVVSETLLKNRSSITFANGWTEEGVGDLRDMDLKIEKRMFVLKHHEKTAKMRTDWSGEGEVCVCVCGGRQSTKFG
jgi:hypothetical protein